MEINILTQADTVVATMRTLPWLTTPMSACAAPRQAAPESALRAASLPVVGYGCGTELLPGVGQATDRTKTNPIVDVRGMDVDHKFSTRLGPTASPPV